MPARTLVCTVVRRLRRRRLRDASSATEESMTRESGNEDLATEDLGGGVGRDVEAGDARPAGPVSGPLAGSVSGPVAGQVAGSAPQAPGDDAEPLAGSGSPPPSAVAESETPELAERAEEGDELPESLPQGPVLPRRSGFKADGAITGHGEAPDGRGVSAFRPLPRVIAIANQKGGVGKTTTTVNLGAALAELGYRVLVVDLDPQGNATTGLGIDARNFERSMYDVLMQVAPLEDCIEATSVRHLFVVPATIDLAGAEIELVPAFSRELRLRRAVEGVVDDFDFVLIDCPPSLGLITINGLAAASEVLVPIQCEYYALEGLGQLLRNVRLVASNLNDTLEVSAIVLTMYDARTRLAVDVAADVREHFGDKVCQISIPRTIRLSEAPSFGQPITVFDPTSRGAVAYRELAKEVSNGAAQRSG
ncbi:MAG: AAA family ATPase [Acidimicrobiales bacterium]